MRRASLIALALLALSGCTSVSETFPGHDSAQVWTAILAVAESPEYDDPDPDKRWWVKENQVFTVPEEGRIEIYRELDRMLHKPGQRPLREHRRWKLQVLFEGGETPRAKMTSRAYAIPVHAQQEADRYFADVRELLAGLPMGGDVQEVPPAKPDETSDVTPFVDIEALEPDGG